MGIPAAASKSCPIHQTKQSKECIEKKQAAKYYIYICVFTKAKIKEGN